MNKKVKRIVIATFLVTITVLIINFIQSNIEKNQKNPVLVAKEMEYSQDGITEIDISGAIIDEPEKPKISAGMIPIELTNEYWKVVETTDDNWYD